MGITLHGAKSVMDARQHWERVYRTKLSTEVSWYAPYLGTSLRLIEAAAENPNTSIIDVGSGEPILVDDLLDSGYRKVRVLDLSDTALEVTRTRLGELAPRVDWLCGDVTSLPLRRHAYDVWRDRAVFHFLTAATDRAACVRQVAHAVEPEGHVIVATFGPEGLTKCSGLDVMRYDPDGLHENSAPTFDCWST